MKKIFVIVMLLSSWCVLAADFQAMLIKNGTYLSIELSDDHLIPPFEAGELWKIIESREQLKFVREKELDITCNAFTNQMGDTIGRCKILMPFAQFTKIGKFLVFKAESQIAARLNRHFIDSAYYTIQRNQVYLSSYNTRRMFYFGINPDLILK